MQVPLDELIKALISEIYKKRNIIFVMFAVISLSILSVGTIWPKIYTSFVLIQVDTTNILQNLMRGTAETTKAIDHGANAREIVYGDRILEQIYIDAKWFGDNQTEIEKERIKQNIKKSIQVKNLGGGLLRITYADSNPERAFITTQRLGELFIKEGEQAKSKESQAAYDFINKQVNEYLEKLTKVENDLRIFRSDNPDSAPGVDTEVSSRITKLKQDIEKSQLELSEEVIRKKLLVKQLSGEAEITISQSIEGKYRLKIVELQDNLETLRLDYTESYPDIIRIKNQIVDVKTSMENVIEQRIKAKDKAKNTGDKYIDEAILINPLYQQLRVDASSNETKIETLKYRIIEMTKMVEIEYERSKNIHSGAASLSQLTRNYDVNQTVYQDLLKRRENARVSRSLDEERSGLTFEIQEPAKLPIIPTGLRFLHFVLASLVLGVVIPVAIIYVMLQADPRIHFSQVIVAELDIPVLASVRKINSYSDIPRERSNLLILSAGIITVIIIFGIVGWLKVTSETL